MKEPLSPSQIAWENLVQRARADAPPPVDLPTLLRAVRQAPVNSCATWVQDFSALFGAGRAVSTCLAAASLFGIFASWQIWDLWQTLPWAQLLGTPIGGGL